jgi:hypothetical protein
MNDMTTKQQATLLLRKYDHMRRELRETERELSKLCTEYGRETGHWGFNKDHLRIQLDNEARLCVEDAAERDAWEKANA